MRDNPKEVIHLETKEHHMCHRNVHEVSMCTNTYTNTEQAKCVQTSVCYLKSSRRLP
jgi:hypothetical protein